MKTKIIKHLKSIAVTFIATFALTVAMMLYTDPEFNYFDQAAIVSLMIAGARAALKVTLEEIIPLLKAIVIRKK